MSLLTTEYRYPRLAVSYGSRLYSFCEVLFMVLIFKGLASKFFYCNLGIIIVTIVFVLSHSKQTQNFFKDMDYVHFAYYNNVITIYSICKCKYFSGFIL